ncbi:transaldolase [Opitutaceae bacterium EW11]|nr:transaldolase [Opitutaceae bacterium EW11]
MPEMTALGADWWNDSGMPVEVADAVRHGAVGGTSNPVIVSQAVRNNPDVCLPVLDRLMAENPTATEDDLAWKLIHALGIQAASQLRPVYDRTGGAKGFLSMQVNPKFFPNAELMVAQATELAALAPNIAIKVPTTEAGLKAIEELTFRGIRINATVSFTVRQALDVSAALSRGMKRAQAAGRDVGHLKPYITLMIGRVDDHLRRVVEAKKLAVDPAIIDWAGIAVFKEAHRLFKSRGLPGTLLAAAYRHEAHWAEIIGPEVLQTIPYTWWKKFNESPRKPALTLETPVDPAIVAKLRATFPDFICAVDEDGQCAADFLRYGATVHTLHQFIDGYNQLLAHIRTRMLGA